MTGQLKSLRIIVINFRKTFDGNAFSQTVPALKYN
jgi:hypothetical protein